MTRESVGLGSLLNGIGGKAEADEDEPSGPTKPTEAEADYKAAKVEAAQVTLDAFRAGNAEELAQALSDFIDLCGAM